MQVLAFCFVLLFSTPLFTQSAVVATYDGPNTARLELYDDGTADIAVPGWTDIFSFDACVLEYTANGGCIVMDEDRPGEPSVWILIVGKTAEIHLPLINGVFVAGDEWELYRHNRPACALRLDELHRQAITPEKRID